MKAKGYVVWFFLQKRTLLSTHQSAITEAPTVFSRLPSLMATDKPCPLLQPSLHLVEISSEPTAEVFEEL